MGRVKTHIFPMDPYLSISQKQKIKKRARGLKTMTKPIYILQAKAIET